MLALPYEKESADCILCRNVISHTDTNGVKRAVSEIGRVLKMGGECYLTLGSKATWQERHREWPQVDENTRDVLLYMENINPGRHEEFLQALDALYDLALRLGGAGEKQIISAGRPACPL